MQDNNNNKLNSTFLLLLRPLARLFLRFGRGYREYSELSKTAFVSVASEDYGVHGRPTNVSRIAAMTGLTRKEISRIRGRLERGEGALIDRHTPVREVIDAWRSKDEFLDADGEPAVLPLDGENGSFRSLIKQYAGDIPEGAMKTELQRIGAVQCENGRYKLLPEDSGRLASEEELAAELRAGPYPLLSAIARNRKVVREGDIWPQETVSRTTIRKSDVRRVRKLVSVRLRAATTNIADLLDAYATLQNGDAADENLVPVSAGVFYAEGLDTKDC